MKLLSFALATCRHFSTNAAALQKKNWSKIQFAKKTSKSGGSRSKAPRKPKIKWTDEQLQVQDFVRKGMSIFVTGSAGTGKSITLERLIIPELKKIHGKSRVFVTASTGVAACALSGQTLHSFAGIGMGVEDGDHEIFLNRVLLDTRVCNRWRKVEALVIDETSMVDAKTFEALAYVARSVRNGLESKGGNKTWGGIQLIVCGDFFQLPPICKKWAKEGKIFAFEAECWDASFDRQVELTMVFRQSDSLLIQLLQGIRYGKNDPDDMNLLKACCLDCKPDPSAVRLFPTIKDVSTVNKQKLESLGKKIYTYKAQDEGKSIQQLKKGIAPDELELCVGARVMLIKNLNVWRKLANGATGTVTELRKVCPEKYGVYDMCSEGSILPVVKFDSGIELVIEPETWVVQDGEKIIARRRQIPLILSWALSIHKCQGMSLDKVHTDLSKAFGYGMVYVALSRVRSLGGLSLSGLDPSKVRAHPKVLEFYSRFNPQNKEILNAGNSIEIDGRKSSQ